MAKEMTYTDASGVEHTEAYFRPVQVNIGVADKTANIVFYGYHNKDTRDGGKTPVGQHSYTITGEEFEQGYAALVAGLINPVALCYKVANETEDVADPKDPDAKRSFFEGAKDV